MRPWPRLAMLLLVAVCVSNVACWPLKKPALATSPPPPAPLPTASATPRTVSPPPRTASAPPRTASAPPHPSLPPRHTPKKNATAKPNPAGGKQEQRATREQPKTAENSPPPSLGQMFTQEERAELTQSLERNLSDARQAMSRLSGHALTAEKLQAVSLVQSLLVQADKARHTDLAVAAQLARRADVLARDLLTSVR